MSNEPDYSMTSIYGHMQDHAKLTSNIRQREIEVYQEQYPGAEIPENLKQNFNVYKAVGEMARQIEMLKAQVNYLKSISRGL